ncbi:MAG: MFS transporter [Tenericutes bacterium]|nr:MFS transporter [Mycoplasmatota bacterium]
MSTSVLDLEKKLLTRNKWTYSLGGIGRDMIYQLVATFFITYIQFALDLTAAQFSVVGILLVIGRVWDGINDPIMGGIVDNTRSRWGKFKPWIFSGAIFTSIAVLFMFNFRPEGWGFVVFFGVIYFFWEIAFTLNDIPYWSLLPNLATNKANRDQITMMVVVFAAVGAFLANGVISFFTVGNALQGYSYISIGFVIVFMLCTCLTVFGVKEPIKEISQDEEKVTIKQMFRAIKGNDQLLWSALALLFYTIGSNLLVALGYNFFYIELGYDGSMVMIFVATFGVSTVLLQSFYAKLAKKFNRNTLLKVSMIVLGVGYILFFLNGYIPFIPVSLMTVCLFGALVFSGQAIFYMVTIVNLTNTIEYNEFKSGKRNEAVMFSLRPFVTKLASALQQGIVTLVLVASGIYVLSQNVSQLEIQKNIYDNLTIAEQVTYEDNAINRVVLLEDTDLTNEEKSIIYDALNDIFNSPESTPDEDGDGVKEMVINDAVNSSFKEEATFSMRLILRVAIALLPVILIFVAYWIFKKKYLITEDYYNDMVKTIIQRRMETKE